MVGHENLGLAIVVRIHTSQPICVAILVIGFGKASQKLER